MLKIRTSRPYESSLPIFYETEYVAFLKKQIEFSLRPKPEKEEDLTSPH